MFTPILTSVPQLSLADFIAAVKNGQRDFFHILGLTPTAYREATFDQLMDNTDDVLAGVNRVLIWDGGQFFGTFPNSLVKYHENGDVKFIFYGVMTGASEVLTTAGVMFEGLGPGMRHEDNGVPFTNVPHLLALAQGTLTAERDSMLHSWSLGDTSWLLQYKTSPRQQFSLMVTINAARQTDFSIRRKGTVLELLQCDVPGVMDTGAITREENRDGTELRFVDYAYPLPEKAGGIFDWLRIRKWDAQKRFDKNQYTMATFCATAPLTGDQKIRMMERLIQIYGSDDVGWGELEIHEREQLDAGTFYTGRRWSFNQQHGLLNRENENEQLSYEVDVDDMADEERFKIVVYGYNELVGLFAAE